MPDQATDAEVSAFTEEMMDEARELADRFSVPEEGAHPVACVLAGAMISAYALARMPSRDTRMYSFAFMIEQLSGWMYPDGEARVVPEPVVGGDEALDPEIIKASRACMGLVPMWRDLIEGLYRNYGAQFVVNSMSAAFLELLIGAVGPDRAAEVLADAARQVPQMHATKLKLDEFDELMKSPHAPGRA